LEHLTNASEQSLERVFNAKVPVILCPGANALLGVGVPRLKEIFENSRVALGTDNVMVNSLDMFRETEFAFKITRGLYKDHTFDAKEVLKAATINGRKILGFESDAIEEGNDANFIIAKATKYLYDPIVAVIHRTNPCDVSHVVKGKEVNYVQKNLNTHRWLRDC
jgi:cytosine/adenosine deaminase-related metal-dependent hydrolase